MLELAGSPLHHVNFDLVAHGEIVEVPEGGAAFETGAYLANILFFVLQRRKFSFENDRSLAANPYLGVAAEFSAGNLATGDGAHLRNLEDLQDDAAANHIFHHFRFEQALHSLFDVLGQAVDDVVQPDRHTLSLGHAPGGSVRLNVEPHHNRVGCRGQCDVAFADRPGLGVQNVDFDIALIQFLQSSDDWLERTLNV